MYNIIIRDVIESKAVFSFSRSSGSGGQNVNKVNTKVTLHIKVTDFDFLSIDQLARLKDKLKNKINSSNELVLSCEEERSQSKNRSILMNKAVTLIEMSIKKNKKRKNTKPTIASKKRRLEAKKKQSLKKEIRRSKVVY